MIFFIEHSCALVRWELKHEGVYLMQELVAERGQMKPSKSHI